MGRSGDDGGGEQGRIGGCGDADEEGHGHETEDQGQLQAHGHPVTQGAEDGGAESGDEEDDRDDQTVLALGDVIGLDDLRAERAEAVVEDRSGRHGGDEHEQQDAGRSSVFGRGHGARS